MAIANTPDFRVDRHAFSVGALGDESDDKRFWLSKSPEERLRALELIRQVIYGYAGTSPRLQRSFEVAEFKTR
jgi:hypothetical protein